MSLKKDLKAAKAAQDKLHTYAAGLPKGSAETAKFLELNSKAAAAANKLPKGLRSLAAIDLLGR
jgi:hypothetical protein